MSANKPTMMTYINEEEAILSNILSNYPANTTALAGERWLILATGSSMNAAVSAKYYIEKISNVHITVEEPFKFQYYEKLLPEIDTIIGVSQSGESTSTIEALKQIKKQRPGIKTLAFTSKLQSEITEIVDHVIDIEIGEERVGYVTKGFSATILKLMLLGLRSAAANQLLTAAQEQAELAAFATDIAKIPQIIQQTENFFATWQQELMKANRYTALCCGALVGTAFEMQTKFCETVRIPSQGMDIEVFMHRPYLEVNPDHQLFFIETESPVKDRLVRLRAYESQYVKNYFTISSQTSGDSRTLGLELSVDEYKAPLFLVIPFQILAHHIAESLGNNLANRIYTDFGVAMHSKTKPGDYA